MSADKRTLAANALRAIAAHLETAPLAQATFDRGYTADQILEALLGLTADRDWMLDVVRDPTAEDGMVDYCRVCQSDHAAGCPVALLDYLATVGIATDAPVPEALLPC